MPTYTLPGIGLTAGWATGENGWGSPMNSNLSKLSILTQLTVEDVVLLSELPASPTNGMIYIVTDGSNSNHIYARSNGAWVTIAPSEGFRAFNKTTNSVTTYVGGEWAIVEIPVFTAIDSLRVLRVNSDGTALEWATATALSGPVPDPEVEDAGKVLRVNNLGNPIWDFFNTGLPTTIGQNGKFLTVEDDEFVLVDLVSTIPPVASNSGKSLRVNSAETGIEWVDDRTVSVQSITTATPKTLAMADRSNYIRISVSAPYTLNIPANGDVPFPIGSSMVIRQAGAGQIVVTPASGVTLSSILNATRGPGSTITLIKVGLNLWDIFGDAVEYGA